MEETNGRKFHFAIDGRVMVGWWLAEGNYIFRFPKNHGKQKFWLFMTSRKRKVWRKISNWSTWYWHRYRYWYRYRDTAHGRPVPCIVFTGRWKWTINRRTSGRVWPVSRFHLSICFKQVRKYMNILSD